MHTSGSPSPSTRRRLAIVAAAVCVVPLGVASRFLLGGWVGDAAGGVLYAVLVYMLVGFAAPGWRPHIVAVLAWGLCCFVELLQLTPIPRDLTAVFPPIRLVLGTTFVAADLLAYAAGAVAAAMVDHSIPWYPRVPERPSDPRRL